MRPEGRLKVRRMRRLAWTVETSNENDADEPDLEASPEDASVMAVYAITRGVTGTHAFLASAALFPWSTHHRLATRRFPSPRDIAYALALNCLFLSFMVSYVFLPFAFGLNCSRIVKFFMEDQKIRNEAILCQESK